MARVDLLSKILFQITASESWLASLGGRSKRQLLHELGFISQTYCSHRVMVMSLRSYAHGLSSKSRTSTRGVRVHADDKQVLG